jgi:hypothetical protein
VQKTKAKSSKKTTRSLAAKKPLAARAPIRHVRHVLRVTPKFVHGMVVGGFVGLLIVSLLRQVAPVNALSFSVSRDCTANAVIHCGALTTDELKSRYSQSGVAAIYSFYGISASDISSIGSTAVAGTAYKDGSIKINSTGKIVATGSTSAGRRPISGSTRMSSGGVTFYDSRSQTAFRSNAIAIYVVMSNDEFKFAIVPNCGNPMRATPVPKPKPEPEPEPTPPANLAPPLSPPPTDHTPIPEVEAPKRVAALPVTGPREVAIIGVLAVVGGYIFHVTHRRVRTKKRHTTHHLVHRH